VETAQQMHDAVLASCPVATVVIKAAAVADDRRRRSDPQIKKSERRRRSPWSRHGHPGRGREAEGDRILVALPPRRKIWWPRPGEASAKDLDLMAATM